MASRAIALFSGGLDSMLAAHVARLCGIEVQILHFRTPFTTLTALAEESAATLGLPLLVHDADETYLRLVAAPRFGRCEIAAPCLDCREHLFRQAAKVMEQQDAQFVVTGDVLGQRRWGQRRRDFEALAIRAGLDGLVERPLSALLLEPTTAQRNRWIDRERLYDIQGKGRRRQLELAAQFGWTNVPAPLARCCQLADAKVGHRVLQAIEQATPLTPLACELMTIGAAVRATEAAEITLSRNAHEGARLREIAQRHACDRVGLLEPLSFRGPVAVMHGTIDAQCLASTAVHLAKHHGEDSTAPAEYLLTQGSESQQLSL